MSPQDTFVTNAQTSTKTQNNSFVVAQPDKINAAHVDTSTLQSSKLIRVRELQATNEALQKQIVQMEKELKDSHDSLTLLAEREKCLIMITRNAGEISKIHSENEERLRRIAELETENNRLKIEITTQRDKFIETHDARQRAKYASTFFLTEAKIEKNNIELSELTQE